jgi:hypothetical protein
MARYNSINQTASLSAGSTISTPSQGLYTEFTGIAPYNVDLPSPVQYLGSSMTFYNSTSGVITLRTVSNGGYLQGPGQSGTATTYGLPAGATVTIFSDGTNFQLTSSNGSNTFVNNLTASGTVALSPANTTVTISPTGTGQVVIAPATAGTIDNVTIGGVTPVTLTAGTVTINTALTGNGTISGGTF